jgi:hypothetical protein
VLSVFPGSSTTAVDSTSGSQQVENRRQNSGNNDPEQLKPVEERNADELWQIKVVKRGPEQDYEGDEQEEQNPGTTPSLGTSDHAILLSPLVHTRAILTEWKETTGKDDPGRYVHN